MAVKCWEGILPLNVPCLCLNKSEFRRAAMKFCINCFVRVYALSFILILITPAVLANNYYKTRTQTEVITEAAGQMPGRTSV